MKKLLMFIMLPSILLVASCSKEKEELTAKTDQIEAEQKVALPPSPIPWPRTSLKRVSVFLQGLQMVPAIRTSTKGTLTLNLYTNKYVGYKLALTNLEPGDFATSAVLYQGVPGTNGTPVYVLHFYPGENGVNKNLLLTNDEFNTLTYLLTPPVLPLIPNTYFVVTTYNHPAGLLRGKIIL